MVRAKQGGDHAEDLRGYKHEADNVPPLEDKTLEFNVWRLAARQDATREACLANGRLDEGAEVSTAAELVLDTQAAVDAKGAGPLSIDLALEIESALLVGDVTRCNEQRKTNPEQEGVPRKEGTVIEQDSGPADERCKYGERGRGCADDEFGRVADTDDVSVGPNVEPDEEAGDEAS